MPKAEAQESKEQAAEELISTSVQAGMPGWLWMMPNGGQELQPLPLHGFYEWSPCRRARWLLRCYAGRTSASLEAPGRDACHLTQGQRLHSGMKLRNLRPVAMGILLPRQVGAGSKCMVNTAKRSPVHCKQVWPEGQRYEFPMCLILHLSQHEILRGH